ncbi:hypothetical protein ABPG74_019382 [Tetrahymena malaccensis]
MQLAFLIFYKSALELSYFITLIAILSLFKEYNQKIKNQQKNKLLQKNKETKKIKPKINIKTHSLIVIFKFYFSKNQLIIKTNKQIKSIRYKSSHSSTNFPYINYPQIIKCEKKKKHEYFSSYFYLLQISQNYISSSNISTVKEDCFHKLSSKSKSFTKILFGRIFIKKRVNKQINNYKQLTFDKILLKQLGDLAKGGGVNQYQFQSHLNFYKVQIFAMLTFQLQIQ